ncbi:flagellar M-ring protein FliF [Candidatus Gastranaerophilus sp. (ex Termes propinquus)]|nr:flagellar M-ring protein FliF [Candidatus Gastranaerophilus sp. (ex Termes propinquus)]
MDLKSIYENKPLFYGLIGGVVLVLFLTITIGIVASTKKNNEAKNTAEKLDKDYVLFTTDKTGLAIEVQALLAREGIRAARELDGTKSMVVLKAKSCNVQRTCTMDDRDNALLAMVKSGLVDEHMGLEIFDKGDFTSTKEDKRIRLVRAINGELSRLIRKIPPIENAQVFISIPEQTFFASRQKPITATVQITIPSGAKLENIKIKAITNLLLGAVHDLQAENISITDTNGNVYNSIIDASNDALSRIEENDRYMQAKVGAQLDRLVGKGNYVVTVSTFLTQAPIEKTSIIYDPTGKTSVTEQQFTEKLGDVSSDVNSATNAVSVYLPYGVPNSGSAASQNRSYTRQANETQYGVSKTQVNEYMKAGVIEEISVAVSMEQSMVPLSMTIMELKTLIAHAASPMVSPDNVSIAFVDSNDPLLAPDKAKELPKPEESGNPWWVVGIMLLVGLGFGLRHIMKKVHNEAERQEEELELLRKRAEEQEKQLENVNMKAAELIQRQAQMAQNLIEQQNLQAASVAQMQAVQMQVQKGVAVQDRPDSHEHDIHDTLSELSADFNDIDENEAVERLKSWIDNP